MREIDFLPAWYKSDRQQQISYRTQYIALCGIFVVMIVCNFVSTCSISKATTEYARGESRRQSAESTLLELGEVKSEVAELQKKADVLREIDSRIDVACVLAEISFLTGKRIILGRVELTAEKFPGEQGVTAAGDSVVRIAGSGACDKEGLFVGNVRFKVMISGLAADASDIAQLVCRLEDSPYFCRVYPSFSRNKRIKATNQAVAESVREQGEEGLQVTEFEIGCYLANYIEN